MGNNFNSFSQNQNNQSFGGQSSSKNEMPNFDRDSDPFGSSSQIDISDDDLPF
jgi:single-strand DNA-binding protein